MMRILGSFDDATVRENNFICHNIVAPKALTC